MSERSDVRFRSGDADCAAWLYLPEGPGPHPAVVLEHGLGAVKEMRLDAYAERFTAAGYACLVFDHRHFGASGGQPRQLLSVSRQLADWKAAIGYVRGRPDRVGCPLHVTVCDADTVAPARTTLRHVRQAPQREVLRRPVGHFDIYQGGEPERVVGAQLEFLRRHVPLSP